MLIPRVAGGQGVERPTNLAVGQFSVSPTIPHLSTLLSRRENSFKTVFQKCTKHICPSQGNASFSLLPVESWLQRLQKAGQNVSVIKTIP